MGSLQEGVLKDTETIKSFSGVCQGGRCPPRGKKILGVRTKEAGKGVKGTRKVQMVMYTLEFICMPQRLPTRDHHHLLAGGSRLEKTQRTGAERNYGLFSLRCQGIAFLPMKQRGRF